MSFYVTYPSTSVSSGPIQFYLDGSPVYVSEDTGTPANSVPLPVVLLDGGGVPIGFNNDYGASSGALRTASQIGNSTGQADFGAGNASAQTLRAVLADDQNVPVKPGPTIGSSFSFNGLGQNAEIPNLDGQETWDIYVSAVGAGGTLMVFGSPDPTSVALQSIPAVNLTTGETSITINAVGFYRVNIAGFSKVRLEVTAYGSGPIAGIQLVAYNSSVVSLGSPLPTGSNTIGTVTAIQGTANATPWNVAVSNFPPTQPVSGPLTDTQLRATPVPISGTVTANAGTNLNTSALALETTQVANGVLVGAVNETAPASDTASSGLNGRLQRIAQRITSLIALLPASLGQKTMANSLAVVVASDQSAIAVSGTVAATQSGTWTVQPGNTQNTTPWLTKESVAATATPSNVSGSASSVSLLASNANRLGATFFNDSTAVLYLKFGTTASTSSFTVKMVAGAYYELPTPHLYTGAIDGIWDAANGAVRITELS